MHKAPGSGCRRTCVCSMAFGLRVCRSLRIIIIIIIIILQEQPTPSELCGAQWPLPDAERQPGASTTTTSIPLCQMNALTSNADLCSKLTHFYLAFRQNPHAGHAFPGASHAKCRRVLHVMWELDFLDNSEFELCSQISLEIIDVEHSIRNSCLQSVPSFHIDPLRTTGLDIALLTGT